VRVIVTPSSAEHTGPCGAVEESGLAVVWFRLRRLALRSYTDSSAIQKSSMGVITENTVRVASIDVMGVLR